MNLFENLYNTKTSIKRNSNIDDELKEMLLTYIDDIMDTMADYYDAVYTSKKTVIREDFDNIKDYQTEIKRIDTNRRNSHDRIIYGLANIDRLSRLHGFKECYGGFSQAEIKDSNLIVKDVSKREMIANNVFESIGKLVRGFEIEDKEYGSKKIVKGITQIMEEKDELLPS